MYAPSIRRDQKEFFALSAPASLAGTPNAVLPSLVPVFSFNFPLFRCEFAFRLYSGAYLVRCSFATLFQWEAVDRIRSGAFIPN